MKNILGYKTQRKEGTMSTLTYVRKIVRPTQVLIGALATYIVALLSNGPTWINQPKILASIVMAILILSSSIWHYGARSDVYAKKWWDPVYIKNPNFLRIIGFTGFLTAILISLEFLPIECTYVALFDAIAIMLYAKRLDKTWPIKNLTIALVCITPLLLGWLSGHRLNPITPPFILVAFFIYLGRELIKDIMDMEANNGKRFTMPIHLGAPVTLRIAGIILLIPTVLIGFILEPSGFVLPVATIILFIISGLIFAAFAIFLLAGKDLTKRFQIVDLGVATIIIGLFIIRAQIY